MESRQERRSTLLPVKYELRAILVRVLVDFFFVSSVRSPNIPPPLNISLELKIFVVEG